MLVLTRKLNETIIIDGDICITVLGIRGNQVRIGIEAPEQIRVLREELCQETSASRTSAAAKDAAPAAPVLLPQFVR